MKEESILCHHCSVAGKLVQSYRSAALCSPALGMKRDHNASSRRRETLMMVCRWPAHVVLCLQPRICKVTCGELARVCFMGDLNMLLSV